MKKGFIHIEGNYTHENDEVLHHPDIDAAMLRSTNGGRTYTVQSRKASG